jgi:hypothetical protein
MNERAWQLDAQSVTVLSTLGHLNENFGAVVEFTQSFSGIL